MNHKKSAVPADFHTQTEKTWRDIARPHTTRHIQSPPSVCFCTDEYTMAINRKKGWMWKTSARAAHAGWSEINLPFNDAHAGNHIGNVLFERNAQSQRSLNNLISIHAGRKALLSQTLENR